MRLRLRLRSGAGCGRGPNAARGAGFERHVRRTITARRDGRGNVRRVRRINERQVVGAVHRLAIVLARGAGGTGRGRVQGREGHVQPRRQLFLHARLRDIRVAQRAIQRVAAVVEGGKVLAARVCASDAEAANGREVVRRGCRHCAIVHRYKCDTSARIHVRQSIAHCGPRRMRVLRAVERVRHWREVRQRTAGQKKAQRQFQNLHNRECNSTEAKQY